MNAFRRHPVVRFQDDPEYARNVVTRTIAGVRAVIGDLLLRRALGARTIGSSDAGLGALVAGVSATLERDGCHDVPDIGCTGDGVELTLDCVEGRRTFPFAAVNEGEPHPSLVVAIVDRVHYERLRLAGRDQARWSVHPAMIVMARALRIPLLTKYRGVFRQHGYNNFERQGRIWRVTSEEIHERSRALDVDIYVKNDAEAGTVLHVGSSTGGFRMIVQGMPQTVLDQLPGRQLGDVVDAHEHHGDLRIARVDFDHRTARSTIVVTPRAYIPVPPDLVDDHD